MGLSKGMFYGAQMALVVMTAALLVGLIGLQRARAAPPGERAPAVERAAPAESPPAYEAPDGAPRRASGDLDRYGGHGRERAAGGHSKADGGAGGGRTRASPAD